MSWIRRTTRRVALAAGVAAALLGLSVPSASGKAGGEYVKYYAVTSSDRNLTGIADRLLGDGSRSGELFNLNAGRRQPDGMALTNPARLNAGWLLVLPWDAVGAGVQYGLLPDQPPVTAKPSTTPRPARHRRPVRPSPTHPSPAPRQRPTTRPRREGALPLRRLLPVRTGPACGSPLNRRGRRAGERASSSR